MTWNTDRYLASLRRRLDTFRQQAQEDVAHAAQDVHTRMIRRAPVDTGEYRDSIELEQVDAYTWRISSDVAHAQIIEFGGFRGVGPKTVQTAEGIFSKQAPFGVFRISLLETQQAYHRTLSVTLETSWRAS